VGIGIRQQKASCTRLEQNWHVQDYYDDDIVALKKELGIYLSRKYQQLADIKKILAAKKKTPFSNNSL
jgi:hypothetical protein